MPEFQIEVRGDVRELYAVEAETEEEARAMFENGTSGPPWLSEVEGSYIHKVVAAQ